MKSALTCTFECVTAGGSSISLSALTCTYECVTGVRLLVAVAAACL